MSAIIDLIAPWFGGILAVGGAVIAALFAVFRARSQGKKEGVQQEQARQVQAESKAKDVVHEVKEDIRSIPPTPEGKTERNERAERWVKR